MARLEAQPLDVSYRIDLVTSARQVISALAPLAIQCGRQLALIGAEHPVYVTGKTDAIEDALRNLIENGLAHTPAGTAVTISVEPAGTVKIADRGPGIPESERARLFE